MPPSSSSVFIYADFFFSLSKEVNERRVVLLWRWKAIVFQLRARKGAFDWRLQAHRVMVAKPFSNIRRGASEGVPDAYHHCYYYYEGLIHISRVSAGELNTCFKEP